MSTGIARLGRCDVGNRNINGGLGGLGMDMERKSQMRTYDFSATGAYYHSTWLH